MRFVRQREEEYSLQLTPLIDVVFLLLIFFMVSTAFVDFTRQMDIELPETKAGAAPRKAKVYTIEIKKDGSLFLDGKGTDVSELTSRLKGDEAKEARSAVIRADKGLDYGFAVEVMGICRQAGIKDIGLAVQ